ncbi:MAG: alkaline shock response membrane anchor protein AmaP [Bacillota bacterium]
MKHYQNVLIGIYSLLIAALALLVTLVALGWDLPMKTIEAALAQQQTSWVVAAVAILVFLLTLKLFFDSFRSDGRLLAYIKPMPLGEIHITQDAIENMIRKSLQSIDGISGVNPKIKCTPEGVALLLKMQLLPETNIPEISQQIQGAVKEYLETHAGINLLEAKVVVEATASGNRTRVN